MLDVDWVSHEKAEMGGGAFLPPGPKLQEMSGNG